MGRDKPDWTFTTEISAGTVKIDTSEGPVLVDATGSTIDVKPVAGAIFTVAGDVNATVIGTVEVYPKTGATFNVSGTVNVSSGTVSISSVNTTVTIKPELGSTFDVNIKNTTINVSGTVNVGQVNSTVTVMPDANATFNVNVTNSSINVNGTVNIGQVNSTVTIAPDANAVFNVSGNVTVTSGTVSISSVNTTVTIKPETDTVFNVNITNPTVSVSGTVNIDQVVGTVTVVPASNAVFNVSGDVTINSGTVTVDNIVGTVTIKPEAGATFNVSGNVSVSSGTVNINSVNTTVSVQAPPGEVVRTDTVYSKVYWITRSVRLRPSVSDSFTIPFKSKIAQIAVSFTYTDYTSPLLFEIEIYNPATGATYTFTADDLLVLSGYRQALASGFAYTYKDFSPVSGGYVDTVYVDANNLGRVKSAGFVIRIPMELAPSGSSNPYIRVINNDPSRSCTVHWGFIFLYN